MIAFGPLMYSSRSSTRLPVRSCLLTRQDCNRRARIQACELDIRLNRLGGSLLRDPVSADKSGGRSRSRTEFRRQHQSPQNEKSLITLWTNSTG